MFRLSASKKVLGGLVIIIAGLFIFSTTASAQVEHPSQISIQGTGLFSKSTTTSDGSTHDATNSGGFLVGYSYQFSRWAGAEANYGYSRNTQNFSTLIGPTGIQSNIHEITGAFVAHVPLSVPKVRPYALAGTGALIFDPRDSSLVAGSDRQSKAVFLYGGGVNFDVTNHVGLRAEYRGLVFKAPDFNVDALNLDKTTHLAQPSLGIFFRF